MVEIDGSFGEGGGQILRTALALSALTGTAVRVVNIRARRPKPGLMAQHLKAVEAAAAVSQARVTGASLGSRELCFEPTRVRGGDYRFAIGTAGSTALVLQTVFLPLCAAPMTSEVEIEGGTHVPWSPCFDYLAHQWQPFLRQMGLHLELELLRAGFYPRGGGRIRARVSPSAPRSALRLVQRGDLVRVYGVSAVARLGANIARRQRDRAVARLREHGAPVDFDIVHLPAPSPGTMLLVLGEFAAGGRCCYFSLGARGKPAERVADEAVEAFEAFLQTDGAIDEHLVDQLLLPAAFAPGTSEFRTARVTAHLLTNLEVVRKFLAIRIAVDGERDQPGLVRVEGSAGSWPGRDGRGSGL